MIRVRWKVRGSVWVRRTRETAWTRRDNSGTACCEPVVNRAEHHAVPEYLASLGETLTPAGWVERLQSAREQRFEPARAARARQRRFRRPPPRSGTDGGRRR
jgi:hypothetical protein